MNKLTRDEWGDIKTDDFTPPQDIRSPILYPKHLIVGKVYSRQLHFAPIPRTCCKYKIYILYTYSTYTYGNAYTISF